ncbi:MAG: FixG Ig-like domain-containing protein, partial [Inhella sp.]
AVMWLIVAAVGASLWMRPPLRVDVVRDRGALARWNEQGQLENVYRLQLMNLVERSQTYRIRVESDAVPGLSVGQPAEVTLGSIEARWVPVSVHQPTDAASPKEGAHPVRFIVERVARGADGARDIVEHSTFVVPR